LGKISRCSNRDFKSFHNRMIVAGVRVLQFTLMGLMILSCAGNQYHGADSRKGVQESPVWMYDLPQASHVTFAIGDAPLHVTDNGDSLEAVEVAAFRLAVSHSAQVEYALAEVMGSSRTSTFDYVLVEPDSGTITDVKREMRVLDSFQGDGAYHLLVMVTDRPEMKVSNDTWKWSTRRKPNRSFISPPEWTVHPPKSGHGVWYGLGISQHTQPLGWEIAERHARGDIAAQLQTRMIVGQLDTLSDYRSDTAVRHKATCSNRITSSKLVARWKDTRGYLYCLVKMDP